MQSPAEILASVRTAAARRILILPHAIRQMSRPDRMITVEEVRSCVLNGEVVEDYPEDVRGHSCLMMKMSQDGRFVHVVCSPKPEFLAIITAYEPDEQQWESDRRTRRRS